MRAPAMTPVLRIVVLLIGAATIARSQDWPGPARDWNGFARHDFEVDGSSCYVVKPKHPAPGNPWVWRARFPNYHREADVILLARGFHIARINTDGMLGSPRAMKHWDAFYSFMIKNGLAKRVALHGVSRGGLFVYGFASRHPERVACVYADTPVCDVKSWPGGKGNGLGHAGTWRALLKEYGFTEKQALDYAGNPIDTLEPIARARIPILHIVSLTDKVVPPAENTFLVAKRYQELGGAMEVIVVKAGTQKSNGHHFAHPDNLRVADFIERHASAAPKGTDYFVPRGSLNNSRITFEATKKGRVAFLGGSITQNRGWRDLTKAYLKRRFPDTAFEFIDAGISSTGSTPGAFRLHRDVLSKGKVDLLFEEAAVNDLHNMRSNTEMTRGMEGIIRHARASNPAMDVVVMHFVDPHHMTDYRAGKTPTVIAHHEAVAAHHDITTIHLSREVTERVDAGQFTWEKDFRNLHPSPYGQRLYAATIRRTLSAAWAEPRAGNTKVVSHPAKREPLDAFSYDRAKLISPNAVGESNGFVMVDRCDPRADGVRGGVRAGFVNVPMLVGMKPGARFEFAFEGRAIGLFVAAGPDAGIIEYRIDDGEWKKRDLFTKWSRGLHIPWAYVLESELDGQAHTLTVRTADGKNPSSKGHACRIVNLLVNE
ncbi:MAG: hypothetical protein CMJ83_17670 [Planctomycetes bacterium]|nr:hypothetical protein [Planctomycetota bacterium]